MSPPADPPSRPKLIQRLLERREHHQTRSRLYRIAFGLLGALILLAGLVMLVTPGPAFVLVPLGLAMLALEFKWAERLLERALEQAERARAKAANTSPAQKVVGAIGGLIGAVIAFWVAVTLVF